MTSSRAAAPNVPDLGDPSRWMKTADSKVIVTPDNFIRAESDVYMAAQLKDGAFGRFKHTREVAPVDKQLIVRLNRDTISPRATYFGGGGGGSGGTQPRSHDDGTNGESAVTQLHGLAIPLKAASDSRVRRCTMSHATSSFVRDRSDSLVVVAQIVADTSTVK